MPDGSGSALRSDTRGGSGFAKGYAGTSPDRSGLGLRLDTGGKRGPWGAAPIKGIPDKSGLRSGFIRIEIISPQRSQRTQRVVFATKTLRQERHWTWAALQAGRTMGLAVMFAHRPGGGGGVSSGLSCSRSKLRHNSRPPPRAN